MSWTPPLEIPTPQVEVKTTSGRGLNAEEVADLAVSKLISISDTAPTAIKAQAIAFREHMRRVVLHYVRQAIASDRTTVYNALREAGHPDLAEMIRRL